MSNAIKHKERSKVTRNNNYTIFEGFKRTANKKLAMKESKKSNPVGNIVNGIKNLFNRKQGR